MNIPLLREIQRQIANEPYLFLMEDWRITVEYPSDIIKELDDGRECNMALRKDIKRNYKCGTALCIAGWANYLTPLTSKMEFGIKPRATELLEIPTHMANKLFYLEDWPDSFFEEYMKAESMKEAAQVACRYIDHLINEYEEAKT